MPRDTIVSWETFVLFLLFPPLAVVAIALFPLTLAVLLWLYYRGKLKRKQTAQPEESVAES